MEDISKTLLNLRSVRFAIQKLTPEQVEEAYDKFTQVVVERRKQDIKAREEYAIILSQLLSKTDVDFHDIIYAISEKKKSNRFGKRKPRPAKYKYIDLWGNEKTWTGQGRIPKTMERAINSGEKQLKDFAIQRDK